MAKRHARRIWAGMGGAAVFVLFAGMLFWTKLRVVRDIPRSAYAVPGEEDEASKGDGSTKPEQDGEREDESEQD